MRLIYDKNKKSWVEGADFHTKNMEYFKKIYGDKMLENEQKEYIVKQLKTKLENLQGATTSLVRQSAMIGNKLMQYLDEIEQIEDVIEKMNVDCECDKNE